MSKLPSTSASTAHGAREYGRAGLFGLLTPQGNPTAEPELKILLPADSVILSARLTSPSPDLRQRLIDYRERLPDFVDHFDDIAFDAVSTSTKRSKVYPA
jgi:maleate isomerase